MHYAWALAVLQFHLLRHSLTGGKLIAYFIMGCIVAGAFLIAGGLGGFFYYLGLTWLPQQPRPMALLALNLLVIIYAVGWFWGLAMEVQRSDVVDVRKMLYFPVPLAVINAINFGISLIGFTSLFYLACALGLLIGVHVATGDGLLPGLAAAGAFFFTASAWAYCLRGLMAVWMENKRRRRLLMSILPLFFMGAGFMPMVVTNSFGDGRVGDSAIRWLMEPEQFVWVERVSTLLPTGWLALALTSALTGEGPLLTPIFSLLIFGAAGYHLGYRFTLRYCVGTSGQGGPSAASSRRARIPFTARHLPGLGEETSALALAAFLSFTRHPQMRTMLLAPFGMVVLLAVANSRSLFLGQDLGLPVIVIMWPFFMFSAFFFNLFGMDPRGFRSIMMLPIPRHRVLLAYHLALVPLAGGMGLFFALLGAWYFGLAPRSIVVCILQVVQLFLMFTLAGSFFSIYAPFAIGRNIMRGQRTRSLLLSLLMPPVVGLLMIPTTVCLLIDGVAGRWGLVDFPAGLVLSTALVALTGIAYPFALRHAGDLLLMKEQRILATLQKTAE